ncbi:hypothetical protein SYK_13070 [Pseudodesulfovibrio nedwellii]|uniref:Uncharacterized protein n=1 Tax=Pseudodesulfovibrio nedwellii TaxID=2973072 RepID=A0ABN6S3N5_9BACT|nr:hypothetical protein [Pseudodesulfovibrio nedwellii]BDQ36947.1 hypothetical protein SYK_13070 [Pseudodesulfovibrio nedwellii]
MDQFKLYEEEINYFSETVIVKYDGTNPFLLTHQIDATDYSISIGGYAKALSTICTDLFNTPIQISIVANDEGSFKSVVNTTIKSIGLIGSICGILNFFGIEAQDISDALTKTQTAIVQEFKDAKGDINKLVEKINRDKNLNDDEKSILIESINNQNFREGMDNFTRPLDDNGYHAITVAKGEQKIFSIKNTERHYFKYTPPAENETDFFDDNVEIIYLSPELNRWQFKGKNEFWADIQDHTFINRTKNKKSNELKGLHFKVYGRKITTRKAGQKKRHITWIIDTVSEVPSPFKLPLT